MTLRFDLAAPADHFVKIIIVTVKCKAADHQMFLLVTEKWHQIYIFNLTS